MLRFCEHEYVEEAVSAIASLSILPMPGSSSERAVEGVVQGRCSCSIVTSQSDGAVAPWQSLSSIPVSCTYAAHAHLNVSQTSGEHSRAGLGFKAGSPAVANQSGSPVSYSSAPPPQQSPAG